MGCCPPEDENALWRNLDLRDGHGNEDVGVILLEHIAHNSRVLKSGIMANTALPEPVIW